MTEQLNALNSYAELIVRVGLNLRKDQRLLIWSSVEGAPLARAVAAAAYRAGAPLVETIYRDELLVRARFDFAPRDSFAEHTTWALQAGLEYADQGHAVLSISGNDPDLLSDIDTELVTTVQRTQSRVMAPYGRLISADAINWCVVAYPVEGWARKVFPDLSAAAAQDRLLQTIYRTVRLDRPDPIAAWDDHLALLAERASFLNRKQYGALRFRGPGTDLTVGLPNNHNWMGGAGPTGTGVVNVANLPTEEVFTTPHRDRVDGTVRATMPLNYTGKLIEEFSLTFREGRVVDVRAARGEELLRSLVATDEGAARLGEVALVPASSPISKEGILFYNTLFDENAASHIALGRAYRNGIADGEALDDEGFAAAGGNTSLIHTDFMIGSAEIDVDGLHTDGRVEPLMVRGEWVSS